MQRRRSILAIDDDHRNSGSPKTSDNAKPSAIVGSPDNDGRDLRTWSGGKHIAARCPVLPHWDGLRKMPLEMACFVACPEQRPHDRAEHLRGRQALRIEVRHRWRVDN